MKQLIFSIILSFYAFTGSKPDREYVIKVPEKYGPQMEAVLLNQMQRVSVKDYNDLLEIVMKQLVEQNKTFLKEDSISNKKDSLQNRHQ